MHWLHIVVHSVRMKKDCYKIRLHYYHKFQVLHQIFHIILRLNLLSLFVNLFPMLKSVRVLILVYSILGLTLLLITLWFSSLKVLLRIIHCTKVKELQEKAYRLPQWAHVRVSIICSSVIKHKSSLDRCLIKII